MTIRTTTRNAAAIARAIRQGEDFATSGALKGEVNPRWVGPGRMRPEDGRELYVAQSVVGIDYVVYSYGTPIAYRTEDTGEWVVPDVKYSVTTSKHQGMVQYALRMIGAR